MWDDKANLMNNNLSTKNFIIVSAKKSTKFVKNLNFFWKVC